MVFSKEQIVSKLTAESEINFSEKKNQANKTLGW